MTSKSHDRYFRFMVYTVMLGIIPCASAQPMKPGLWHVNTKITSDSGEVEKGIAQALKSLKKLSPDKRKALEAKMARLGMNTRGGKLLIQLCVTPELGEEDASGTDNRESLRRDGCEITTLPGPTTTQRYSFICTHPPATGEGARIFSADGAHHIKNSLTIIIDTVSEGQPDRMSTISTSEWVSERCGKIKPLSASRK